MAASTVALLLAAASAASGPIIDMHVHADMRTRLRPVETCPGDQPIVYPAIDPVTAAPDAPTVICPRPIRSVLNGGQLRAATIAELRKAGVVRAVLIGAPDVLDRWQGQAPGLFVAATAPKDVESSSIASLRALASSGRIKIFGEISAQYSGIRADDPRNDPFWSLAEELDIPVAIHLGEGTPLIGKTIAGPYRVALTSPFQLEEVLKKHPRLRIWVMHAGSPLTDEMIAMLGTYSSLYVDISANNWGMPRPQFHAQLKKLVEAGFGKRIMFGSDQTLFPQAVEIAVRSIQNAPFLSAEEKRDIFYGNAARFLRLTEDQIAADHR